MAPTTWDLFCGCGGMSLGFEQAGFASKFAFDWERDQAATFALNRPGVPVLRMDVKQISFTELVKLLGRPDVLAGGPPCQGFSSASKPLDDKIRAPKRAIYFHAIRALGEVKPPLFFFENSPNVASQYSKPVFAALRKAGREAKFVVLAAKDFGVPQVRRRAFLVDPAIEPPTPQGGELMTPRKAFAGLSAPSVGGKDPLHAPRNATPEFTARIARAKPGGFLYQNPNNPSQPWSYTNIRIHPDRPTMSINSVGDFCHFKQARKLTFREYLRLQMMPDDYKFFFSTPSNMRILCARILPPPFAKAWALKIKEALSKKQKADLPTLTDHEWELVHADFEEECQKIDTRVVRSVPADVEDVVVSAIREITPRSLRKLGAAELARLNSMTHKLHGTFFASTNRIHAGGIDREDLVAAQAHLIDEMYRCEMDINSETSLNREVAIKAVWTRAFINDLPDSAFLHIASGGTKDEDGKTVPRSLRFFPVRDDTDKLDLPHLRNALARIPQSKLPQDVKDAATRKARKLLEDAKEEQERRKAIVEIKTGETNDHTHTARVDDTTGNGTTTTDAGHNHPVTNWRVGPGGSDDHTHSLRREARKSLSAKDQKECDAETKQIGENKKKPEASKRHKFKPAKYTHKNGHPRCLICGDEEMSDTDMCEGVSKCQGGCSDCTSCEDKTLIKLLPIEKADEDRQIVFGVVLEPNSVDSQGDTISPEEIERASHLWLARFQNRGFMHRRIVNSKIEIYESYLAPTNLTIGGQKVKKGTWLLMYHVLDSALWKDIKDGKLTGFSMGGRARRVPAKVAA